MLNFSILCSYIRWGCCWPLIQKLIAHLLRYYWSVIANFPSKISLWVFILILSIIFLSSTRFSRFWPSDVMIEPILKIQKLYLRRSSLILGLLIPKGQSIPFNQHSKQASIDIFSSFIPITIFVSLIAHTLLGVSIISFWWLGWWSMGFQFPNKRQFSTSHSSMMNHHPLHPVIDHYHCDSFQQ